MKKIAIFKGHPFQGAELELDEVITMGDLLASEQWELVRDMFMYHAMYHEGRQYILIDTNHKIFMITESGAGFETVGSLIDNELVDDELLWKILTASSEQLVTYYDLGGWYFFIRMESDDVKTLNWQYERDFDEIDENGTDPADPEELKRASKFMKTMTVDQREALLQKLRIL